jgi:hypothetical protein
MGRKDHGEDGEAGQATPEYVGVVLLLASVFALLVAAGPALPGGGLARAVASKLVCAVRGTGDCGARAARLAAMPTPTERAYGPELAALLSEQAPVIAFESDDFASLPVDFRECRERACADTIRHGSVERTQTGLEPTAFTHVVDCRPGSADVRRYDCSGPRAGNVYLQYWLYYPDSATHGLGRVGGYHADDWESYQVRVSPDGTADARASSHHGYNGHEGGNVGSDTGWWGSGTAWAEALGELHVASGSHAGMASIGDGDDRRVEPGNLRLIPAEPIARGGKAPPFAVTPPWAKEVWRDPEAAGT